MIFLFTFIACSNQNEENSSDDIKEIIIGQNWVIDNNNPLDGANGWSLTNHGLTEYVYTLQPDGSLKSRFISHMEMIDENNYIATLNKGIKFADGTEVDAEALAHSLNRIIEENEFSQASAGKILYTPIEDYKMQIQTELPTVNIESILAEWTNVVFKEEDGDFIFTGAYEIENLNPGADIVLKRNEYYEDFESRPEKIMIKAFPDTNALKLAYESGELDLAFGLNNEAAKELKNKGFNAYNYSAGYQYYNFLNLDRPNIEILEFREALNHLINREDIIEALAGGEIPKGLFANIFSFTGDAEIKFSPGKAENLLTDLGYKKDGDTLLDPSGKPVTIKILTYGTRTDLPIIGQLIASDLEKMGIKTSIQLADSIDEEAAQKDFDMLIYAQNATASGDPHFFFAQHFKTGAVKNYMGYSNTKVDTLIDKLGITADPDERNQLCKDLQEIIYSELPILYTVDPYWYVMLSENISDYELWNGDYFVINPTLTVK